MARLAHGDKAGPSGLAFLILEGDGLMAKRPAKQTVRIAPQRKHKRKEYGRTRGRAGVALRKRRMDGEPLCRICKANGIIRIAEEWDHIVPLSQGGDDSDGNGQPLCRPCHAEKTRQERLGGP